MPMVPSPWLGVVRVADALGDRPGMNIAVIDLPAFLACAHDPAKLAGRETARGGGLPFGLHRVIDFCYQAGQGSP